MNGTCRICFGAKRRLNLISDAVSKEGIPFSEIYQESIGQDLKEYPNYPLLMCRPCEMDLLRVHEFRKKCLETEEKIRNLHEAEDSQQIEVKIELEDCDVFQDEEDDEPKRQLRSGMISTEERKLPKHPCEICHNLYPSRNSLNAHRWHAHKQRPPVMPCKRCGGTFKDRTEKNGHECLRKCDHCNKSIRGKHFAMHLLRHTNTERNYTCDLCPKSYFTPTDLTKHRLSSHIRTETTICMICGKMVKESHLPMHLKTHDNKVEPKRTYPCTECNKVYSSSGNLKVHVDSIHLGVRVLKLQCPHCEMRFKEYSHRKAHIYKFHLKKPLFSCTYCQKSFYHKSHYNNHITVHHTFEKLFHCKICNKAFALNTRRKMHELLHSDERPYLCGICSKSFKLKNHLVRHMRGHTGEKIFTCPHCSNLFYSIRSVRGHVKRDHPDKEVPPPGTILSKKKLDKLAQQQKLEESLLSIPVQNIPSIEDEFNTKEQQ